MAVTLAAAGAALPARAVPVNRVVLQVNDRIATLRDYEDRLGPRLAALNRQEIDPEERQRLRSRVPQDVMRDLFEEMLILSRADQLGVRVGEASIDALIAQVREANGITTDEELQRAVAQTGQTWEQFRAELAKTQRSQEVVGREVYGRIELEEDDLRIFYRDNPELFRIPAERRLKEIVVLDSSGRDAAAMEASAREIARRLNAGEAMEAVAAELGDPEVTSGVIDLDWVPTGDLDSALEAAIAGLEIGQASEPVVARGGLHVVQVLGFREARIRGFDEVKDAIFARERARLFEREFPKYLEELADKSFIRASPPPGAEGFREAQPRSQEDDPLELFRRPRPAEAAAEAPAPAQGPPAGSGPGRS